MKPGDKMGIGSLAQVNSQLASIQYLPMTNQVTNGDFSNGTTGWTASNSTLSALSNTLSITGNGGASSANCLTNQPITGTKKIYIAAKMRVTNAVCQEVSIYNYTGGGSDGQVKKTSPAQNTWYPLSMVVSTNHGAGSNLTLTSTYDDAATANGKVAEAQYVMILDLTTIFGAGYEPTAEEMDNWLLNFSNSWFSGSSNLTHDQIWKGLLKEIHDIKTAYIAAHGGSL